jgi:hypothetical protein
MTKPWLSPNSGVRLSPYLIGSKRFPQRAEAETLMRQMTKGN